MAKVTFPCKDNVFQLELTQTEMAAVTELTVACSMNMLEIIEASLVLGLTELQNRAFAPNPLT